MTVPYIIKVLDGVTADADGDIDISTDGGYHGEEVDRTFTVEELRRITVHAQAHQDAYQEFKDRDYEDEAAYFKAMKEFNYV